MFSQTRKKKFRQDYQDRVLPKTAFKKYKITNRKKNIKLLTLEDLKQPFLLRQELPKLGRTKKTSHIKRRSEILDGLFIFGTNACTSFRFYQKQNIALDTKDFICSQENSFNYY